MKKTLLVILSLSIVSVANAAIGFVPSKTTVATGETITIRLIADSPCDAIWISVVSDGAKGGAASNPEYDPGLNPWYPATIVNWSNGILFYDPEAHAYTTPVQAGNALFSFDYTAGSTLGQVTIAPLPADTEWWDPAEPLITYMATDSVGRIGTEFHEITGCTITVVPEPMTVVLLGLGGLFLRRHRA